MVAEEEERGDGTLDGGSLGFGYKEELEKVFNRQQTRRQEEQFISPIPISDAVRRRETTSEEIKTEMKNEPSPLERFKRIPAKKWEGKNNQVRAFLMEQYGGKCQICGYTFAKRNGERYFEGLYLVSENQCGLD